MIGARSSRYIVFLLLAASQRSRARSYLAAESNFENFQLPPNRHILTRHHSTAKLRVVGIETSRTVSPIKEPSPESNDLGMSYQRTRETIISPCVGLAPSLNVYVSTERKGTAVVLVYTAVLL